MENNASITLITEAKSVDEYGDTVVTSTTKEVFAQLASIGQAEFYQAHGVGLKPEIKFILSDYYDYGDQQLIGYDGDYYTVLRTYRKGQELEIICKRGIDT